MFLLWYLALSYEQSNNKAANSVVHTSHGFYLNKLFIATHGTNIYIYKIVNDKNNTNGPPMLKLMIRFINLNFQILDVDVSKWVTQETINNNREEEYIFAFGSPAGGFIYKHECKLFDNNSHKECVMENAMIQQFKSSQYNISNITLGHQKHIVAIGCKDGRCFIVNQDSKKNNNNHVSNESKIYMEKSDGRITDMSFNNDDTMLAISFWHGHVYVYKSKKSL